MKSCTTCHSTYPSDFTVCPRDGTALVEGGAWLEGTLIRGKFRILSKLGQGGMGAVYKALHTGFDETRALKVISPELMGDDLFVKRFKREAFVTRKLRHPNAVRVDDIDEAEDGRPFIVMEYIEGKSLKKLIQEEGPLAAVRTCSIVKQVASALEAAHQLGMIHRDIKPDNIFLVGRDTAAHTEEPATENEIAKVLDFGIAKVKEARLRGASESTLTTSGVIGTPAYMSPEQAMGKRGDELDGRSDIYSLGIVMYQMLTSELPFKADTTGKMLLAHMQTPPTPIQEVRSGLKIPESICALVMRCLEKRPEHRPSSAKALIEDLEQAEKALRLGETRVRRPEDATGQEVEGLRKLRIEKQDGGGGGIVEPRPPKKSRPVIWALLLIAVMVLGVSVWYIANQRSSDGGKVEGGQGQDKDKDKDKKTTDEEKKKAIQGAITEGDFDYDGGQYDSAIKAYQEGLKLDPSNAELKDRIRRAEKAKATEATVDP